MFDKKVFGYTFPIVLTVLASVMIAIALTLVNLTLAVFASLSLAALIACYRYPIRWCVFIYRTIMRRLAKRALRSSLSHMMRPLECSGIFEIDGGVAVKVQAGESHGVIEGSCLNVYEGANNNLWGRVTAINVRHYDCDCTPYDRVNVTFWEELENRMRYDTSKPSNVYFVRDVPESEILDSVVELLDNWR